MARALRALIDRTVSKIYGPYKTLYFLDGVSYADGQVFAFADHSSVDWYCQDDGRHWPLMLITSVGN